MYLWHHANVRTLDSTSIADGRGEFRVADTQNSFALGHVGLQEQLKVITDDSLADRVDVRQGVGSSFEWVEANQINHLRRST